MPDFGQMLHPFVPAGNSQFGAFTATTTDWKSVAGMENTLKRVRYAAGNVLQHVFCAT